MTGLKMLSKSIVIFSILFVSLSQSANVCPDTSPTCWEEFWELSLLFCPWYWYLNCEIDATTVAMKKSTAAPLTIPSKLLLDGWENKASSIDLSNNGEYIKLEFNYDDSASIPKLCNGNLESTYSLIAVYILVNKDIIFGVHHTIESVAYDFEVQFAFENTRYAFDFTRQRASNGYVMYTQPYKKDEVPEIKFFKQLKYIKDIDSTYTYTKTLSLSDIFGDTFNNGYFEHYSKSLIPCCASSTEFLIAKKSHKVCKNDIGLVEAVSRAVVGTPSASTPDISYYAVV